MAIVCPCRMRDAPDRTGTSSPTVLRACDSIMFHCDSASAAKGEPFLSRCIVQNRWQEFTQALQETTDLTIHDSHCNTPLHVACEANGESRFVTALLQKGFDANACNCDNLTALHVAIAHNRDADIIRLLMAHGADPYWDGGDGLTAICIACEENHLPAMRVLVHEYGVDLNRRNSWGVTAIGHMLHTTVHEEMLEYMLREGNADPNLHAEAGDLPLRLALFFSESVTTVNLLLRYGANVHAISDGVETALLLAETEVDEDDKQEITEELIRHIGNHRL